MSSQVKEKLPRELDPRNPIARIGQLVDEGSAEFITEFDESGYLAATGNIRIV